MTAFVKKSGIRIAIGTEGVLVKRSCGEDTVTELTPVGELSDTTVIVGSSIRI